MTSVIAPREKLFGHMDRLHELQTTGSTTAPINVEIDLSNRCSLGCEWCHFGFTHSRGPLAGKREKPEGAISGGDLMPWHVACDLIDQLASADVRSVTWTGGGEPTLHPDFDHIVEYAGECESMRQGLYTHGGHIDEDRATLLKDVMSFVYVSLDAVDSDSYKTHKGVDRFENACDGIRRLVAADGEALVGVGFLITRDNWRDMDRMAELAEQLGADYAQFRPTILYDQATPNTPAENTWWMADAISMAARISELRPIVTVDTDRFRMYQNWQGHGYETCWWSALQTCITPNGKVWACVNRREHPSAEIGDLTVDSFADIWSRHSAVQVGADCRVSCRGHIPNLTLDEIMVDRPHREFV